MDLLVVYGDFNCPYSALASARVDRLLGRGAQVEWRAVEHDPDIPPAGRSVVGDLAAMLEREVAEVTGLLVPDDALVLRVPPVQANTASSIAAFAELSRDEAHRARRRLFAAVWEEGRNVGDVAELRALGLEVPAVASPLVEEWRRQWLGFERRLVPMLLLPDGEVSRGRGALRRLAEMAGA